MKNLVNEASIDGKPKTSVKSEAILERRKLGSITSERNLIWDLPNKLSPLS